MSFHVAIIGAGLGGLCLAQGLRRAGISVAVYERDRSPTDRLQGYRIHVDPMGSRALHACLPARLFELFLATSGKTGTGMLFVTEHLRRLMAMNFNSVRGQTDPAASDQSVDRAILRQILLTNLEDVVHFARAFVRYETQSDGRANVFFADGTSATADVIVGADGSDSNVRKQLLPRASHVDMGTVNIFGKLLLTDQNRPRIPEALRYGITAVIAPRGHGMFIGLQEFKRDRAAAMPACDDAAGLIIDATPDYLMWVLGGPGDRYNSVGDLQKLSGPQLQAAVLQVMQDWHPALREIVTDSDPDSIACTSVGCSLPVEQWPTTNITVIGDAIHNMPPARGVGANVALRDADLLCGNLTAVHRGEKDLMQGIHDYEVEMLDYGFKAVRSSRQAQERAVSSNPLILTIVKGAMIVVDLGMRVRGSFRRS